MVKITRSRWNKVKRGGQGKSSGKLVSGTRKRKHTALNPGPYQCHPRVKEATSEGCLPREVLEKAAQQLGVSDPQLRKALEEKLGVSPNHEYSFVQALPFSDEEKKELVKQYLRPPQPKGWSSDPDKWLDSLNIEDVMKQYEDAYDDFEFMGPYPIDFAAPDPYSGGGEKKCLINEVCELRVTDAMKNGTRMIGIIYNLDPHFKGGSHWVAVAIDIPKHTCEYFDSYGMYPPDQIARFMKWLTTQDPKMKLAYNGRRFQSRNTECGMYCLYFIIRKLMGDGFRAFSRRSPPDAEMLKLRHWLFST
jgi:hypothetical protein